MAKDASLLRAKSPRKTMTNRIPQSTMELLRSLRRHTRLLKEYAERAFDEGDFDYVPEVANKLRALTYTGGRNRPLLLDLMDELESQVSFELDRPGSSRVTLREYLRTSSGAECLPSGELAEITNERIPVLIANVQGAHEDWELPPELVAAFQSSLRINGWPGMVAQLRAITNTVILAAEVVLEQHATGED